MGHGHSISETVVVVVIAVLLPEIFLLWEVIVHRKITRKSKNFFFKICCVSYSFAIAEIMMSICDFLRGIIAASVDKPTVLVVISFLLKSISVVLLITGGIVFILIDHIPNKESPGFWRSLHIAKFFKETWYDSMSDK